MIGHHRRDERDVKSDLRLILVVLHEGEAARPLDRAPRSTTLSHFWCLQCRQSQPKHLFFKEKLSIDSN